MAKAKNTQTKKPTTNENTEVKFSGNVMELECPNCTAQMELSEDRQILICPYCGTKSLITESDEVKKEKIRNETIRLNHEADLAHELEKEEEKDGKSGKAPIIWSVFFLFEFFTCLSRGEWATMIVAGVQFALMFTVWICRKRRLLRKKRTLLSILGILPYLLIIVYLFAMDIDDEMKLESEQDATRQERLAEGKTTYVWPSTKLSAKVPEADFEYGKLVKSTERRLELQVYFAEKNDYTDYIKQCKKSGFTYYEKMKEASFKADNEEHYHLEMTWTEDKDTFNTFTIVLEAPPEMKDISWPVNKCTELLPDPPSLTGEIRVASDEQMLLYLGNVSQEQYTAFVDECIALGFEAEHNFPTISRLYYPDGSGKKLCLTLMNWDVMQILVYPGANEKETEE